MLEAFEECLDDSGLETKHIEAAWLGLCYEEHSMGKSSISLSQSLRLPNVPVTRVENLCATGSESLRGAAYAVASGACDIALAMGVEKLKDTGFGGLPTRTMGTFEDQWFPGVSAPGSFAQLAIAYSHKHDIAMDELKEAMAHISWKSHENGALNPKAHLQNRLSKEKILKAPMISYPLGLFDCCGVSDGAACAYCRHTIVKCLIYKVLAFFHRSFFINKNEITQKGIDWSYQKRYCRCKVHKRLHIFGEK